VDQITHIRYRDFFRLVSEGTTTYERFCAAVDELGRRMGDIAALPVLFDLRGATFPPLRRIALVQGTEFLRRKGIGVSARLAIAFDPADTARADQAPEIEAVASSMQMNIRCFSDLGQALDWLAGAEG
jgi:hypothetical protein